MLNGATTKLRSAQAKSTSTRMNRAVLHGPCFAADFGCSLVRSAPRRTNGSCIRPLLSAGDGEVKPGWQLPVLPLCAGGNGEGTAKRRFAYPRGAVRGRT